MIVQEFYPASASLSSEDIGTNTGYSSSLRTAYVSDEVMACVITPGIVNRAYLDGASRVEIIVDTKNSTHTYTYIASEVKTDIKEWLGFNSDVYRLPAFSLQTAATLGFAVNITAFGYSVGLCNANFDGKQPIQVFETSGTVKNRVWIQIKSDKFPVQTEYYSSFCVDMGLSINGYELDNILKVNTENVTKYQCKNFPWKIYMIPTTEKQLEGYVGFQPFVPGYLSSFNHIPSNTFSFANVRILVDVSEDYCLTDKSKQFLCLYSGRYEAKEFEEELEHAFFQYLVEHPDDKHFMPHSSYLRAAMLGYSIKEASFVGYEFLPKILESYDEEAVQATSLHFICGDAFFNYTFRNSDNHTRDEYLLNNLYICLRHGTYTGHVQAGVQYTHIRPHMQNYSWAKNLPYIVDIVISPGPTLDKDLSGDVQYVLKHVTDIEAHIVLSDGRVLTYSLPFSIFIDEFNSANIVISSDIPAFFAGAHLDERYFTNGSDMVHRLGYTEATSRPAITCALFLSIFGNIGNPDVSEVSRNHVSRLQLALSELREACFRTYTPEQEAKIRLSDGVVDSILRCRLFSTSLGKRGKRLNRDNWQSITINRDGGVEIVTTDGAKIYI